MMMEDGVSVDNNNKVNKMGATGNPNATRLSTLQERKKSIEESLAKCTQELRQLCIQEFDLTGKLPQEMPLEPGESPPSIRRRVGTAYEFPENLIKNTNNKDKTIADLELQIQLQANMAEAALGLANEQNIGKTLRRQHMGEYQNHKRQFTALQEELSLLKDKNQQQSEQLHKQKKKPRPVDQGDNLSINEPFAKSELRHSIRSNKSVPSEVDVDFRYTSYPRMAYKNSSTAYVEASYARQDEALARGLYRLSINGYKNYMESRRENISNYNYNTLQYNQQIYPPQRSTQSLHHQNYSPTSVSSSRLQRQSSPSTNKMFFPQSQPDLISYRGDHSYLNPHQIQPHQQYEHMTLGLGGYWRRSETGETIWCNSSNDSSWQRDKRFGSLDRRKSKRMHKRVSPDVDNKSATLATVHVRTPSIKSPQIISRRALDSRQLVRTQSLGSVGAQTIDDDNSSCESDNRSTNETGMTRKHKQKEWLETSLDGPVSPTHSVISRSQSAIPSVLSPEEKYISSPKHIPKPPLEIPAESNPSPRIPETNIELFNNNIPKNCTIEIVQAGHCKPYHEETKPFEMSDFYKYSTKYKKSPVKSERNLNESFEKKNRFSPTSPGRLDNSNSSLDLSQNVAERFSDEMNAWYKSHKLQIDSASGSISKGKSTATLV